MKIIHFTNTQLNEANGITTVLKHLLYFQNLDEKNSVELIIPTAEKNKINHEQFNTFGFPIHQYTYMEIQNKLKDDTPDIVVFHSVYNMAYLKIYKELARQQIKYIIIPHGTFTIGAQNRKKIKKIIGNIIFRKFIESAEAISYLNEAERTDSIYKNKTIIVPNGIDKVNDSLKKSLENNEGLKLFYLGRIDIEHKGLDNLVRTVYCVKNQLKDIKVCIYGTGTENEENKLKRLISEYNLEEFIQFKGAIYGKEKQDMLEQQDIMLLFSRHEGLPMVVLEALSYGIPCVLSQKTNMSREVEKKNCGWNAGNEIDSFTTALLRAVNEYQENKEKYRINAMELIREKYLWETVAKYSVDEYRSIIATGRKKEKDPV